MMPALRDVRARQAWQKAAELEQVGSQKRPKRESTKALLPPQALKVVASGGLVAEWEVVKQPPPGQLFRSVVSAFGCPQGFKKWLLPCRQGFSNRRGPRLAGHF